MNEKDIDISSIDPSQSPRVRPDWRRISRTWLSVLIYLYRPQT